MATQAHKVAAKKSIRLKSALESKLRDLVSASHERDELRVDCVPDPIDQVRSRTDREVTVQQLDYHARLIHDVQAALAKFEQGTYGLCERCESPIPPERLDAVPWAHFCGPCQSESEATERYGRPTFVDAA